MDRVFAATARERFAGELPLLVTVDIQSSCPEESAPPSGYRRLVSSLQLAEAISVRFQDKIAPVRIAKSPVLPLPAAATLSQLDGADDAVESTRRRLPPKRLPEFCPTPVCFNVR